MRLFTRITDAFTRLAYPAQCQVCGSTITRYDDGVACGTCWDDPHITTFFTAPLCGRCGVPLLRKIAETGVATCGLCEALPFAAARACGNYGGALEASILYLKSQPHICRRLHRIICEVFAGHCEALAADVIIPVPLHPQRQRERGHNQAEVISSVLSRSSGIPDSTRTLVRVKHTERHRIGLDARDRSASVERAFRVVKPQAVNGFAVLLVDDVFTTGSTLAAAARALIDGGARQVNVLTIARVPDYSLHTT